MINFNRCFDMMSLVWVGFSSKLQVRFNWNLVPNAAKNMADLINIKQIYIYSLFSPTPRSFKGWVKFPRLAPMHGIDLYKVTNAVGLNWDKNVTLWSYSSILDFILFFDIHSLLHCGPFKDVWHRPIFSHTQLVLLSFKEVWPRPISWHRPTQLIMKAL
jgi:hypothetical protein